MRQGLRVSVRLDCARASLLRKLSSEVGCPPSEVLRRSLDHFAASRSPRASMPKRAEPNVLTVGLRHLPITSIQGPKAASAPCPDPRLTAVVKAATSAPYTPTGPEPSFPPGIAELVTQCRAFGSELRRIRRQQFQRALAASVVAMESAENSQDAQVYMDLLSVGRKYSLLD